MSTEASNNSRDDFFKEYVLTYCMNLFVVDRDDEDCVEELIQRVRELQARIAEERDNRTGSNI
jgi:hypothetical protein